MFALAAVIQDQTCKKDMKYAGIPLRFVTKQKESEALKLSYIWEGPDCCCCFSVLGWGFFICLFLKSTFGVQQIHEDRSESSP